MPLDERQVLCAGKARGRLMGGNLTVLSHLMGTRYAPDLRGSVLFVEEVGEEDGSGASQPTAIPSAIARKVRARAGRRPRPVSTEVWRMLRRRPWES